MAVSQGRGGLIPAILATSLMNQTGLRFAEVPVRSENQIVVCAIKAPRAFSDREQATWHVLAQSLLAGNESYSREMILSYGGQAGVPPTVTVSEDLVFIRFVQPPGALGVTGGVLRAMLTRPQLRPEDVKSLVRQMEIPRASDAEAALMGAKGDFKFINARDLESLWRECYRPENVFIAMSLSGDPGSGIRELAAAIPPWDLGRTGPGREPGFGKARFKGIGESEISAWVGPSFRPTTNRAADILAVFALGAGKESAAFRVLREQQGLCYLAQCFLWPTRDGWRPMMMLGGSAAVPLESVRKFLGEDIAKWDESRLRQAKAMAATSFASYNPMSPVLVAPRTRYSGGAVDRVTWTAYWGLQNLTNLSPEAVLADLQAVKLDELKAASLAWLDSAMPYAPK